MKHVFLARIAVLLFVITTVPQALFAADATSTTDDIQKQIDAHNAQIAQLNQEIADYQNKLNSVSTTKQTLQSTLNQIGLSINKTTTSIKVTQNVIGKTQLQIQQLNGTIGQIQNTVDESRAGLTESIQRLNESETQPLMVQVLSTDNISDAWNDVDAIEALQGAVRTNIAALTVQQQNLDTAKNAQVTKKQQLVTQQQGLLVQKSSLAATKQAKSDLLVQTKAQESNFQNIIAQKKLQESAFEDALNTLQSKLKAVNSNQITAPGKGVLSWPLDHVVITQYFGNTAFAATGAYNGKGHNGIDLGASIGTPVKSAGDGVILGTGNTDLTRGCYSFGKWVLIKHNNGLDTIYGHLSKIDVMAGQTVSSGEVIGYSGETGYATGPHLHFGVYVSSATQIMKLGDATKLSTPCAGVSMPVAPLSGYLNPLNYMPA